MDEHHAAPGRTAALVLGIVGLVALTLYAAFWATEELAEVVIRGVEGSAPPAAA